MNLSQPFEPAVPCPQKVCVHYDRDLKALYSIAQVLALQSGQRPMLENILEALDRELGMIRGTILLLSADEQELVVEAVRNSQTEAHPDARYHRGEGIVGQVIETGQAAIIPRISAEPAFRDRIHRRSSAPEEEELSFICVPILAGNEAVGTLSVDLPQREPDELEADTRVLSIVASMIAHDVRARRLAALERQALEQENEKLRFELREHSGPKNIIGNCKAMRHVYQLIDQVATSDTSVIIRGESGTGKELVASAIHFSSRRADKPFIKVNCAALNESLIESELFGHEKGAFTGALFTRIGRIETAEGGTLFLDEIGDFSPAIQVKLLRVIQEREFERVGSNQTRKANVRLITATNRDLEQAVQEGVYRQDLYYRINVFQIHLPPLRERKDDILLLANHFIEKYSRLMGKPIQRIGTPAINMLMAYHWPGNVRELENCIEHAVLLATDGTIHSHNLPPTLQVPGETSTQETGMLRVRTRSLERDMIVDALKRTDGNMTAAARQLGITPRMIRYRIAQLKIDYQGLFRSKT